MNRKEVTKTFMMISNRKKPFGFHDFHEKFSASRVENTAISINPFNAEICLYKPCGTKVFFSVNILLFQCGD